MAKNDNRAPEDPAKTAPAAGDLAAIEAKLGPLDEFRGRADSWMKEITAQVARLAGRSEDEERRKGAIDKRLNDIEDRMQSLLTLTEMVSLSKNPFAGPQRSPAGAPAPPADAPPTAPAEAATEPAEEPAQETDHEAPEPSHETKSDGPQEALPAAAPAPPAPTPIRAHPNDATADPGASRHAPSPGGRSVAEMFPQRNASAPPSPAHAQHRLFVLEWARLLAPAAERIDLSGFLGFYVESGWVTADIVATVRNLTLQLSRVAKDDNSIPLDELHARSILLLGRLQGTAPPPEVARATMIEAREASTGPWATIQG